METTSTKPGSEDSRRGPLTSPDFPAHRILISTWVLPLHQGPRSGSNLLGNHYALRPLNRGLAPLPVCYSDCPSMGWDVVPVSLEPTQISQTCLFAIHFMSRMTAASMPFSSTPPHAQDAEETEASWPQSMACRGGSQQRALRSRAVWVWVTRPLFRGCATLGKLVLLFRLPCSYQDNRDTTTPSCLAPCNTL